MAVVTATGPGRKVRGTNRIQRGAVVMTPLGLLCLLPFFYVPLFALLVRSFRPGHNQPWWGAYHQMLSDGHLASTLGQSFEVAGITFVSMLIIGYPLAYIINFRMKKSWQLPMLLLLIISGGVSDIVRIFAWFTLLGYHGILNEGLLKAHLIHQPISVILFSRLAVVLVLAAGWLPYVVIPIYAAMRTIDGSYLEAARDLYSNPLAVLRHVVAPMSAPGILGAFIVVFVPLLSEFATPQLVGGPKSLMIGNLVSDQLLEVGNVPAAAAGATLLLVIAVILITAAQRVSGRVYGS
jgi:spermidine/putrescine transport system permease protein